MGKNSGVLLFLACATLTSFSQGLEVRYDKKRDLSVYKTFIMGESDVITPADRRKIDEKDLKDMVNEVLISELTAKGLQRVDKDGDLVASFVIGEVERSEIQNVGPLGGTPGEGQGRSSVEDIKEGMLSITLHDRNKNLIWRVNGTGRSDLSQPQQFINEIIINGFKKFSLKPLKKKKHR